MVSTVRNPEVKQKDADCAVVVAVSSRAVFEPGADGDGDGDAVYGEGVAFPLLQALQRVNERLLEGNPAESLLFDVVLVTTDSQQQRQSHNITSSTKHYGLDVSRFCFSSEEDFTESLLENNVHLFLTTDADEASQASQRGVLSALLDHHVSSCPSEQLRVLFSEDTVFQTNTDSKQNNLKTVSSQLGEMRRRFGLIDSPLSFLLVTSRGGRQSCGEALLALRSRGVSVDEAYCLAGAPRGPILSLLRPHFLLCEGPGGVMSS